MDLWYAAAAALLLVWAGLTFGTGAAPGWINALLTAGVFLVIFRVVQRGTARGREGA